MTKRGTMRAAVLFGPDDLRIVDRDVPVPADGEVLMRVEACAICGSDAMIVSRPWEGLPPFGDYVPGHEFCGTVAALGGAVDEFSVGDRVAIHVHKGCGRCENCMRGMYTACLNFGNIEKGHRAYGITVNGGYAQYAAVHVSNLYRIPDNVSFEEATLATTAGCGLYGLEVGGSRITGETVAVMGPGPIGLMVVQLCKALGASRVILTGTRESRLALGAQLGADHVVRVRGAGAADEIRALTRGVGADVSVDCAGTQESFSDCILATKRGGRVILLGNYAQPVTGDMAKVVREHLTLYGIRGEGGRACGRALALMSQGRIKAAPLITHRFPLADANRAMTTYRERIDGAIKVVILPWA